MFCSVFSDEVKEGDFYLDSFAQCTKKGLFNNIGISKLRLVPQWTVTNIILKAERCAAYDFSRFFVRKCVRPP